LRLSISNGAAADGPTPRLHLLAAALVALAVLCSLVAFGGWLFDVHQLRDFGIDERPIWPLTSLGYASLSAGYLAALFRRHRLATVLWTFPILLACLTFYQYLSGTETGTDQLFFADLVISYEAPHPGRPGLNPSTIFLLLAGAGLAARAGERATHEAGILVSTLAFGLALSAAVIILFSTFSGTARGFFSVSMPSAVAAASLSAAFLVLHGNLGWVRKLAVSRGDWRTLRLLMPAVLILPVVPSAIELAVAENDLLSPLAAEALVVLFNILIVAFLGHWAVTRISRQHATMLQFSEALDKTTVVLADVHGRITHWSEGCRRLYGWTAAEALGQHKYALLRSRCQGPAGPGRGSSDGSQELVEVTRDGREVAVIERSHRLEGPGREPLLVLSITDVTQRLAALEALQTSEERLALATSAHELGVFEWDVQTGRLEWSPGTEQRLGLIPGRLKDFESWRAAVEPEDVQYILDTIARTVQSRADKFSFGYRLRQANGTVRAVEGSSRAFYDAEGNLLRTVGVMLDVTEREEREAALRRREAQLRSILETLPDAMVVIDRHGLILQFSAAAEALWGYRSEDVVGQHFTMLSPESERQNYRRLLEHFVETGDGILGEVLNGVAEAADGRSFPIETRTGVANSDGEMLLTVFVRDLAEQLATEARISDLSNEMAHVSRQSAMSELAADLAHELNQPLSATSNFLAAAKMLLERGESAERIAELLKMGSEQTQRAGDIIRRMRAFMARGEVEMRAESIERTVRDAADLLLVGPNRLRLRLSYDLASDVRLMLADRVQVQQVLVNLVRNATEAMKDCDESARQVTISSRKIEDQMVEIAVADNGPGIPAHVLENLFTRFTTTKSSGGGMGIGLSISKRIIEAHGGTLSAENLPEGGACFRFTLPAIEQGVE
jgi:two-component system sensor kinase FixL